MATDGMDNQQCLQRFINCTEAETSQFIAIIQLDDLSALICIDVQPVCICLCAQVLNTKIGCYDSSMGLEAVMSEKSHQFEIAVFRNKVQQNVMSMLCSYGSSKRTQLTRACLIAHYGNHPGEVV